MPRDGSMWWSAGRSPTMWIGSPGCPVRRYRGSSSATRRQTTGSLNRGPQPLAGTCAPEGGRHAARDARPPVGGLASESPPQSGWVGMQEFDSGPVTGATVVATVKWYDPVKGYGFLTPADGLRDVFCHVSAVSRAGLLTLGEGATVTCEVVQGRQGPQVERIHTVDASTALSVPAERLRPIHGEQGHAYDEHRASPGQRVAATVKCFVASKGFGFLTPDDGSADVVCHVSFVEEASCGTLVQGASVICAVVEGRKGPVVSSRGDGRRGGQEPHPTTSLISCAAGNGTLCLFELPSSSRQVTCNAQRLCSDGERGVHGC